MAANIRGVILNVVDPLVGDTLVGDHDAGVVVLQVSDAFDFAEDGGLLRVGTEQVTYSGIDDEASQVMLLNATTLAWPEGTEVVVLPETREKTALISVADDGDAIEVRVPAIWYPMVADAIRDPSLPGIAELRFVDGEYVFVDVWGSQKTIDGSTIDPTTLPTASDGLPPSASPLPEAYGGPGYVQLKWVAPSNSSSIAYDIHIGLPGFTPDVVTYTTRSATEVVGTQFFAYTLPDGTPFEYGTDYGFRIAVYDVDGHAAISDEVVGRLRPITSEDISVDSVAARHIMSDAIDGRVITGTTFQSAESGERSVLDTDGLRIYFADGSVGTYIGPEGSMFSGDADINQLRTKGAALGGATSLAAGGTTRLSAGQIADPTLPLTHESVPLEKLALIGGTSDSSSNVVWDSVTSRWWRMRTSDADARKSFLFGWDATGVRQANQTPNLLRDSVSGGSAHHSIAVSTSYFYMLYNSSSYGWIINRFPRSGTTISDADCFYILPTVAGGYSDQPAIGMAADGDLLVGYKVTGAQTIAGLSFADADIHVGKYTPSKAFSNLILTQTKTIRLSLGGGTGGLSSVGMDTASSAYDITPLAGNTGLRISSAGTTGIGPFSLDHVIAHAPNAGSAVTASFPGGIAAWYGSRRGLSWNGSNFFGLHSDNATLYKFGTAPVTQGNLYHGYDFYNSATGKASLVSPLFNGGTGNGAIFARYISRWSIPNLPAGVTQVRIYVGASAARLKLERQGGVGSYYTGVAGQPLLVEQVPTALPAGGADAVNPPSATNTFPTGVSHFLYDDYGNSWDGLGSVSVKAPVLGTDATNKTYVDDRGRAGVTTVPSGSGTVTVVVAFATALPATPVVVCTRNSSTISGEQITAVSTTGFSVSWSRASAGTYTFNWIAMVP